MNTLVTPSRTVSAHRRNGRPDRLVCKRSALALLGVLAVVGIGYGAPPAVSAVAAPGGQTDGEQRPYAWTDAGDPSAGRIPTLTNSVGQHDGDGDGQRFIGFGLLMLGLLGLVSGGAWQLRTRRAPGRPHAPGGQARREQLTET